MDDATLATEDFLGELLQPPSLLSVGARALAKHASCLN